MRNRWLDRWLESIADRGREFLKLRSAEKGGPSVQELCRALLSGQGEASGVALSREILLAYRGMDATERAAFFEMLHSEFSADAARVRAAADAYLRGESVDTLLALNAVVEPPRQELLRRLNMAAHATGQLVSMRGALLALLKERPHLKDVDADFKHLLSSWFNRGFLQLRRIDWQTSAEVLEKLINYEAVHAIQGWDDLRRRLADDRRCFAFFHPAMPDEPLIFVEVALVQGMSAQVAPLLDLQAPVLPAGQADTAIFYSINNTQAGLRGVSFGNFLIKQVLAELHNELPGIKTFATLSPMPRFAPTIKAAFRGEREGLDRAHLDRVLSDWAVELREAAQVDSSSEALLKLLAAGPQAHIELVREPLERLALTYLTLQPGGRGVFDPVAGFHLSNGARLERINVSAASSPEHWAASFGVMVNYLYEPDEVEANHERFASEGIIALSKPLARAHKRIAVALHETGETAAG